MLSTIVTQSANGAQVLALVAVILFAAGSHHGADAGAAKPKARPAIAFVVSVLELLFLA